MIIADLFMRSLHHLNIMWCAWENRHKTCIFYDDVSLRSLRHYKGEVLSILSILNTTIITIIIILGILSILCIHEYTVYARVDCVCLLYFGTQL